MLYVTILLCPRLPVRSKITFLLMDVFMLEGDRADFQYELASSKNRYSLCAVF